MPEPLLNWTIVEELAGKLELIIVFPFIPGADCVRPSSELVVFAIIFPTKSELILFLKDAAVALAVPESWRNTELPIEYVEEVIKVYVNFMVQLG